MPYAVKQSQKYKKKKDYFVIHTADTKSQKFSGPRDVDFSFNIEYACRLCEYVYIVLHITLFLFYIKTSIVICDSFVVYVNSRDALPLPLFVPL